MTEPHTSASPPAPATSGDAAQRRNEEEIDTAAAFLSLTGPCQQAGHVYLACVATAGLGMCRHLRASFTQCTVAHAAASRERLQGIGQERCSSSNDNDKTLCAARIVLRHYMPRPPSSAG